MYNRFLSFLLVLVVLSLVFDSFVLVFLWFLGDICPLVLPMFTIFCGNAKIKILVCLLGLRGHVTHRVIIYCFAERGHQGAGGKERHQHIWINNLTNMDSKIILTLANTNMKESKILLGKRENVWSPQSCRKVEQHDYFDANYHIFVCCLQTAMIAPGTGLQKSPLVSYGKTQNQLPGSNLSGWLRLLKGGEPSRSMVVTDVAVSVLRGRYFEPL